MDRDDIRALLERIDRQYLSTNEQPATYADYLRSEHWRDVRARACAAADYRCQLCYSRDHLEVHHRTYERLGHELPGDVTVLCSDCHGKFHGIV